MLRGSRRDKTLGARLRKLLTGPLGMVIPPFSSPPPRACGPIPLQQKQFPDGHLRSNRTTDGKWVMNPETRGLRDSGKRAGSGVVHHGV